jgi:hypothetical protein
VVKYGNKNTKSLAYKSLVRPILEYEAACWDPYRESQIKALERVQNKAAKFAHHEGDIDWEPSAQHRKTAGLCAFHKAYKGESVWINIRDRLHAPSYLSRVDHKWKIKARNQRKDIGKYSFVNRTIVDWNQLSEEEIGVPDSSTGSFRKKIGKWNPE